MNNSLKFSQIAILAIIALILTYFLSSVLIFALNHQVKMISKFWTFDFPIKAIIGNYPKIWHSIGLSFTISSLAMFLITQIKPKQGLFGDAKFANSADLAKYGLFPEIDKKTKKPKNGIIIGKYKNKLLRYRESSFIALGAPTRAGKGVSIVIPNLFEWQESLVVQDIKQECFDYTSAYREQILGQEVYLFDPFSARTHRYNPLTYFDINSPEADNTINSLAASFFPEPKSGDPIWSQLSQDLFAGIAYTIADLVFTEQGLAFLDYYKIKLDLTFYDILHFSIFGLNATIKVGQGEDQEEIKLTTLDASYKFLEANKLIGKKAIMRMKPYVDTQEKMKDSVLKSFQGPLKFFQADYMRFATSGNDFDFRDLRKKKMTIYIGITPNHLSIARPILNIFWEQLLDVNTAEMPQANKDLKYKVLLLMDEATAPGKIARYESSISFMAGYYFTSLRIYQTNAQLNDEPPTGYGVNGAKKLLANHQCKIYFAPSETEDAEKLEKDLGSQTVKNRSRNLGANGGGSESDAKKSLMLAQELKLLDDNDEIILMKGKKPILCQKAIYYNDPYFMDKFKAVSPTLQKVKGIPSKAQQDQAMQNDETRAKGIPIQSLEKLETQRAEKLKARWEELAKLGEENENV